MSDQELATIHLPADEIMRLHVQIAAPKVVGPTGLGLLQVIPIIGGTFTGQGLSGTIVPGGADWNTTREAGVSHVFAKYLLQTDDGEYIAIENEGVIEWNSEATIKTRPTFAANVTGKYRNLNCGVYVGELSVTPDEKDSVDIVIYKLR
ncbi:MAG TPA: DUF3237 domain-containing protein [Aggregatilineaceae bacterium]|nr:DUF3237 domain-containing protein [Aggregatilineaceae bacterium]